MRYSLIGYFLVTFLTWLIDFLTYTLARGNKIRPQTLKTTLFLIIPSLFSIVFFALFLLVKYNPTNTVYLAFQYCLALYLLCYLPKLLYLSSYYVLNILNKIIISASPKITHPSPKDLEANVSRRKFVSVTGIVLAFAPFLSLGYGILRGRFEFKKIAVDLKFRNLPSNFIGLKIIQISDIHLGSFVGFENKIEQLVDEVNAENADLLIFSGDLVNNFSSEANQFIPTLSKLKAKLGKVAILGNHDYGDYSTWDTPEHKREEQKKIQNSITSLGFRLLLNETIAVHINGQEIGICGVENWGHPPFPKYGDLKKAAVGIESFPFNILLTHDPDHWEAEVLNKKPFDLTLSGHTHGMQIGIEWGNFKWSPANWRFKRWGGLYQEGSQLLYVNRGIGSIGIPARMGMPPEISIITLSS